MKSIKLVATSVLLSSAAFAATVTCTGVNPGVNKVDTTVTDKEAGNQAMHFKLTDLANPANAPWEFDANPQDIIENTVGYQRLSFVQGHHNTLVSITADADVFGFANAGDTQAQNAGYRGKVVLWTGPGDNPQRTVFDVVCK